MHKSTLLLIVTILSLTQVVFGQAYTFVKVADVPPFLQTSINNSGDVPFVGGGGVSIGSASGARKIADVPNICSTAFILGGINNNGKVVFTCQNFADRLVYFYTASSSGEVTQIGNDNNQTTSGSYLMGINDSDSVVYTSAPILAPSIKLISGGTTKTLADRTGAFANFFFLFGDAINNGGRVVFTAANGGGDTGGIYEAGDVPVRLAVAASATAPVSVLYPPEVNDSNAIAYISVISIYLKDAQGTHFYATRVPGPFSLNNHNEIAYTRQITDPTNYGIFFGPEPSTKVIAIGDTLFGDKVTTVSLGQKSLNDRGQIAFFYRYANGTQGIAIATPTSAADSPVLHVSSSHAGSFVQGQAPGAYTLSVQNDGSGAASGTISVSDTLPAGITATAIAGPGWSCTFGTLTCTRSDGLASGGRFPPITLTVSVAANAGASLTNQVSVSGGGAGASGSDPTTVIPAFTDVSPDDVFLPAINLLRQSGITTGCQSSPPKYCSTDSIPESQMAVFVIRSVLGGDPAAYPLTPYFTDVPSSNLYFRWIQMMQYLGIGLTCAPNQYCPDSAVTRGIMAVLIIRSRLGVATPTNYPTTPYFTDVPSSHPYFPWIQKMKQLGITTGCSATTYCPDDPVTRGQMAVFLMRGEFNQLLPADAPSILWTNPAAAQFGTAITVTLVGQNTHFSAASVVDAGPGITVSNVTVIDATTLTAKLTIASAATLGPRTLTVTTGSEEAALPHGFLVQ